MERISGRWYQSVLLLGADLLLDNKRHPPLNRAIDACGYLNFLCRPLMADGTFTQTEAEYYHDDTEDDSPHITC